MDSFLLDFKNFINTLDNPKDVLWLLRQIKSLTVFWFRDHTSWSDRQIANKLHVSNTLVSRIKATDLEIYRNQDYKGGENS